MDLTNNSELSSYYLYPFVLEITIFCKITESSKSIRFTQLAQEIAWFVVCDSKVVREASLFIDPPPGGRFSPQTTESPFYDGAAQAAQ